VTIEPSIRAAGLEFRYAGRDGRSFALRCPTWEVRRGERIAIRGPSGSGKSTLLNLVAGVLRPDRGTLRVEGRELSAMDGAARRAFRIRSVGFVFQDFPLVEYLDAEENVLLPFRLNAELALDRPARDRARVLLERLGLGGRGRALPGRLSQGERHRLAIARALVTEPPLLLADEPTAGLDPEAGERLMDLLVGMSTERGCTLVVVTHDPVVQRRLETVLDVRELATGSGPT
jgi:ABC-type lipoprotein export system ATPase subunit